MEKVIAYKSSNGRLFDSEEKCIAYEKKLSKYPKVKESIDLAARSYKVGGQYENMDIVRHTIERREKPSSRKSIEKYFIVGGKYKFIDIHGKHEASVMDGGLFTNDKVSMNWYLAFRHFAEQILLGNELTDEFVLKEIEKINKENDCLFNTHELVANVIEPNRKWEIDNPKWKVGYIAPYTFTIEKLD